MVHNSAKAIYRLIDLGVEFAKEQGRLKLTREGGHGKNRIAYVGDYTGREIEHILVKRTREHPNIEIMENTFALKLIMKGKNCYGCQVIHQNKIINIFADQTILATGGVGQIFANTTNPKIATGDGIALGMEVGLKTRDLEFIQFHPTALAKKTTPYFLISEAVRGEGAKIVNNKGKRFMKNSELAPRDVVAREIYREGKNGQVYLDVTHKSKNFLQKRFPQIYQKLSKNGFKMEKDLIPVTPAAHYLCGGIVTDMHGRTSIKRLFAFGEVTCTGVHGANRLASNSLLEALVFSNQVAQKLETYKAAKNLKLSPTRLLAHNSQFTKDAQKAKKDIQKLMWEYAGIIRDRKKIKKKAIPLIKEILKTLNQINGTNQEIAESLNMAKVSLAILKAAYKRRKSLGCHFVE